MKSHKKYLLSSITLAVLTLMNQVHAQTAAEKKDEPAVQASDKTDDKLDDNVVLSFPPLLSAGARVSRFFTKGSP